jgi:hypothetical protein
MEAVPSGQNRRYGLQWAGAIRLSAGTGWRTRRIAESYDKEWYGAGDRDTVIHDGKDASFCRSCRFVCSFIAHLLPTSIILVRSSFFLSSQYLFSSHVYCLFFVYFLILLLLQRNDPTPQTPFAFAVNTDEQRFMLPPPVLALLGPTMIFLADV